MSHRILVTGGIIVTMDRSNRIIEQGYVVIEDGRIKEVAEGEPSLDANQIIDATNSIVMPGIVVAHTHLYGILLRGADLGIEPPTDFAQVLQRIWWPVDEALTLEDAYASALSASAEMLRNGCTFFADTYSGPNSIEGSLDYIARAVTKVGIRGMLAFEMTERHSTEEAIRGLKENVRFAKALGQFEGLVSMMMSVHASFTVSDEMISQSFQTAKKLGVPLTIHTSEGLVDLYHNLERYGERTVERLDRLGVLGPETVLAHCVHINETELDIIAERGAAVAHNPMSNMLNAVGVAPVPEMLERGIPVGLGNDGWIFDPFENMRCALTIHRLAQSNPSAMSEFQVLKMATIDAAKCYGLENKIGSIESGKLGDLIVIDGHYLPTPLTPSSVINHIVHSISGHDVLEVIVAGKSMVHDGHLVKTSLEQISEISRKSATSLWERLKEK